MAANPSDVERLFSRAGIIFSSLRTNFSPSTLHALSSLHFFYKHEKELNESNVARDRDSGRRSDLNKLSQELPPNVMLALNIMILTPVMMSISTLA